MLAVVKEEAAPGIAVRERREPTPGAGEALVAVAGTGICGSDLHAYEWVPEYAWLEPHLPTILGHEIGGTVLDGGVSGLAAGTVVAVRPAVTCGRCEACKRNVSQRCPNRVRIGYERDGGLASQVVAPAENLYALPDAPAELAPLVEPLTVAVHSIGRAAVRPGAGAAVIGCGAIGLMSVEVLRARGADPVLLVGTEDDERGGGLGIGQGYGAVPLVAGSAELDEWEGSCESVIVAAGAPAAVATAIRLADRGATLVVLGLGIGPVELEMDAAVRRELSLVGGFGAIPEDWLDAVALMRSGAVTASGVVSHRVPIAEAPAAFELLASHEARKAVLYPE
jgi:L-iditol 2-dehydrogenase